MGPGQSWLTPPIFPILPCIPWFLSTLSRGYATALLWHHCYVACSALFVCLLAHPNPNLSIGWQKKSYDSSVFKLTTESRLNCIIRPQGKNLQAISGLVLQKFSLYSKCSSIATQASCSLWKWSVHSNLPDIKASVTYGAVRRNGCKHRSGLREICLESVWAELSSRVKYATPASSRVKSCGLYRKTKNDGFRKWCFHFTEYYRAQHYSIPNIWDVSNGVKSMGNVFGGVLTHHGGWIWTVSCFLGGFLGKKCRMRSLQSGLMCERMCVLKAFSAT